MTIAPPYTDGKVSVQNGSTTVTGDGTAWELAGVKGGILMMRGFPGIPIANVISDTEIELLWPWPHAGQTNATYAIDIVSAEAATALFLNTNVRRVIQQWFMSGLRPYGAGTLAERNALSPQPPTGEFWLRWEEGQPLEIYRKEDTGWSGPRSLQGPPGDTGATGAGDRFDIAIDDPGKPIANEVIARFVFATDVTFPENMSASRALSINPADEEAVYSIRKNDTVDTMGDDPQTEFATVTFAAASTQGVFASGGEVFQPGDILTVVAPDPQDTTLSGITMTISGERSHV